IFSLPVSGGFNAIDRLSVKYVASIEATAIRFVKTNPRPCALLSIENHVSDSAAAKVSVARTPDEIDNEYSIYSRYFYTSNKLTQASNEDAFLLSVEYSISPSSQRLAFPSHIRVREQDPLYESWTKNRQFTGVMPSSAFGFEREFDLWVECKPWGYGRMLVLVWLPMI
ncbi:MAG TPA: hypothetical protein VGL77_17685, partial [Armatimonadota bacterium]